MYTPYTRDAVAAMRANQNPSARIDRPDGRRTCCAARNYWSFVNSFCFYFLLLFFLPILIDSFAAMSIIIIIGLGADNQSNNIIRRRRCGYCDVM